LFAAAKPVTRDILERAVGRDYALDLLLDGLREDLRGRPIELARAGGSYTLHTRPAFAPAVRVAFDVPADAKALTKLKAGVLMAVAYFQPVTRWELSETFGREISRDLIAALRSPTLGAPYAYVTTEKFLPVLTDAARTGGANLLVLDTAPNAARRRCERRNLPTSSSSHAALPRSTSRRSRPRSRSPNRPEGVFRGAQRGSASQRDRS
jgi:chromosome segregation and condensation protein ScpB